MLTREDLQAITWDRILVPDGHEIYGEELYENAGVPRRLWQHLVKTHVSSQTDFKEAIHVDGRIVDEVPGIYHLDFLWALAGELDADRSVALGCRCRGREAEALVEAIKEALRYRSSGDEENSRHLRRITDPLSGRPITVNLNQIRLPPGQASESYRGFSVVTGPVDHYYLAAIFTSQCDDIVGPAQNAATALFLAHRRIDAMLSAGQGREGREEGGSENVGRSGWARRQERVSP